MDNKAKLNKTENTETAENTQVHCKQLLRQKLEKAQVEYLKICTDSQISLQKG